VATHLKAWYLISMLPRGLNNHDLFARSVPTLRRFFHGFAGTLLHVTAAQSVQRHCTDANFKQDFSNLSTLPFRRRLFCYSCEIPPLTQPLLCRLWTTHTWWCILQQPQGRQKPPGSCKKRRHRVCCRASVGCAMTPWRTPWCQTADTSSAEHA